MSKKNSKKVTVELTGYELARAKNLDLLGIKAFRLSIRKATEENTTPEELELLNKMEFTLNKINEHRVKLEAYEDLYEKYEKQYKKLKVFTPEKRAKLQENLYKIYIDFLNDENIGENYKQDLNDFYSIKYDQLYLEAWKFGKEIEQAKTILEEYLEQIADTPIMETPTSQVK